MIEDGQTKIDEYIAHRKQREEEILQALSAIGNEATSMELVKIVYKDVPENLHEPAANGVIQVLRKLKGEVRLLQLIFASFKQIGSTETMSRCSHATPRKDNAD